MEAGKLPSYQLMGSPTSTTSTRERPMRTCAIFSLVASILALSCALIYSTHLAFLLRQPSGTNLAVIDPMVTVDREAVAEVFPEAPVVGSSSDTSTLGGSAKPSESSVVPTLASRAESLDVTSWTWKHLAESVLCSSGSADKIREALHTMQPSHHLFVLVTKPGWNWSNWLYFDGEHLQERSKCSHDLWVWNGTPPISSACTTTEVRWANYIINEAVRLHSHPEDIRKAIYAGMSRMNLKYHFIAAWDPNGFQGWSYWAYHQCMVSNSKALVYLKP